MLTEGFLKYWTMKKAILIFALIFSTYAYPQDIEPTFEKVGKMIKATYFHENGEVAQAGYLLNGKLHSEWLMFDTAGKKIASGKYVNGQREGKWFFWEDEILREVDFKENRIASVKNWNAPEVVSVD